jgi:hypothetical protein
MAVSVKDFVPSSASDTRVSTAGGRARRLLRSLHSVRVCWCIPVCPSRFVDSQLSSKANNEISVQLPNLLRWCLAECHEPFALSAPPKSVPDMVRSGSGFGAFQTEKFVPFWDQIRILKSPDAFRPSCYQELTAVLLRCSRCAWKSMSIWLVVFLLQVAALAVGLLRESGEDPRFEGDKLGYRS